MTSSVARGVPLDLRLIDPLAVVCHVLGGVARVDDERGVLNNKVPVVRRMIGGDDNAVSGAQRGIQISHPDHLDPAVLEVMQAYDSDNIYGLPYMWGSTGYTINVEMVKKRMPDAPLGSGAMLFDPEVVSRFADCGVTFTDEPMDVIPMALQYLGYGPDSLDPAELAEAEAQLKAVRPYIRYFSSTKMLNDLPNEEVCVAVSWSGDYAQAMNRAKEVGANVEMAYYTPVEGWIYWFDGLFIPADAPNLENAYLFLNYLLRPEVIAAISNETHYANGNLASLPFMDANIVNDPAVYPPPAVRQHGVVAHVFGPKVERGRIRAWSRIKTGL